MVGLKGHVVGVGIDSFRDPGKGMTGDSGERRASKDRVAGYGRIADLGGERQDQRCSD